MAPGSAGSSDVVPPRIEDYALLGDCRGAALVSKDGSIDWMCLPRFDSPAVFARLLGNAQHGYWALAPRGQYQAQRSYHDDTMVLETRFSVDDAQVLVEDALITGSPTPLLVRKVSAVRGRMEMETTLVLRPDYGSTIPWIRRTDDGIKAIAGPDEWNLQSPLHLEADSDARISARFAVAAGEELIFVLSWHPSHEGPFEPPEHPARQLEATRRFWQEYAARATYQGPYRQAVVRSILVLKALTYAPTGGIVAAPTTSLPEIIGGSRNWDYRFCWVRDSTFSVYALLRAGYRQGAEEWIDWLVKAVAGSPGQTHMLYGVAGERRLTETELPWLPGYEGSRPVRIGNAASEQLQLDVFGEVMDTLHAALREGMDVDDDVWRLQEGFMAFLERDWDEPDEGIWEIRGPRRHFTHSKLMAWVAVDRAIRNVQFIGCPAPLERWRALRATIHQTICERGFNPRKNAFVQSYDSEELDASLLMMPLVGFLPVDDPRITGTVAAIERELMLGRYVRRYDPDAFDDGIGEDEGAFIACSFWLADNWALAGKRREAQDLFEHLLSLRNDVGLLAEEYDPRSKRMLGNFPQAFSHIALINTAFSLLPDRGPARHDEDPD
jgi:GH15 family glucan-1,4-alpha-glucosidase